MRILDRSGVCYEVQTYECENFVSGSDLADRLGLPHESIYKTLVTVGKSKAYYVFVIPIDDEIDFKKAARLVGEKSLSMLPLRLLTEVTGYVRGGCTALGMKKSFPTFFQKEMAGLEKVTVSGGRLGLQLILAPDDLVRVSGGRLADVTEKRNV